MSETESLGRAFEETPMFDELCRELGFNPLVLGDAAPQPAETAESNSDESE